MSLREKRTDELRAWPGCGWYLHWVPIGKKCVGLAGVSARKIMRKNGLLWTQRGFYAFETLESQRAWGQKPYPIRLCILPQSAFCRHLNNRIRERKYSNGFWLSLKTGRGLLPLNSGCKTRPSLLSHARLCKLTW